MEHPILEWMILWIAPHVRKPQEGSVVSCCIPFFRLVGGLEHEFYFPIYWEFHHPNWRTHIFQRGGPGRPTSRARYRALVPSSFHRETRLAQEGSWNISLRSLFGATLGDVVSVVVSSDELSMTFSKTKLESEIWENLQDLQISSGSSIDSCFGKKRSYETKWAKFVNSICGCFWHSSFPSGHQAWPWEIPFNMEKFSCEQHLYRVDFPHLLSLVTGVNGGFSTSIEFTGG